MTDDNPLREANPFSLDELMSRDPLALRREPKYIAEQVAALRRQREKWAEAEAAGKRVRNKRAKKVLEETE